MDRCPTCQARLREAPVCTRCGTDLSLPLAAEVAAEARFRRALQQLVAGDRLAARRSLAASLDLKRAPLAAALLGFLES